MVPGTWYTAGSSITCTGAWYNTAAAVSGRCNLTIFVICTPCTHGTAWKSDKRNLKKISPENNPDPQDQQTAKNIPGSLYQWRKSIHVVPGVPDIHQIIASTRRRWRVPPHGGIPLPTYIIQTAQQTFARLVILFLRKLSYTDLTQTEYKKNASHRTPLTDVTEGVKRMRGQISKPDSSTTGTTSPKSVSNAGKGGSGKISSTAFFP